MQSVLYSTARNNLRELINKVCDNYDEVIINTKDNKSAVLISLEEYESMKETLYLISSKKNKERLDDAVKQIENSNFVLKDLNI